MVSIRLVTFDALHTLLAPRLPIYVQYSEVFSPFLGVLEPESIKHSFKAALKQLQAEKPAYQGDKGAEGWWAEVIRRTALGAGGNPQVVNTSLSKIVPRLMMRFSSKEGYKLFDDVVPAFNKLKTAGVKIALVSNADSRMRSVLDDLRVMHYFSAIILSEEVGVEKPTSDVFLLALRDADKSPGSLHSAKLQKSGAPLRPEECLHIGDELKCDYYGARSAGMRALLLRRPDYEYDSVEGREDVEDVKVIRNLDAVPLVQDYASCT